MLQKSVVNYTLSRRNLFMNQRIIVLDTETGGLDPLQHSLLQVGIMVCENGEVLEKKRINIVHETYNVTPYAMKVNKIDLASHIGVTANEAVILIKEFVQKYFVEPAQVLGHNVSFDVGFVKELFKGSEVDYEKIFSYRLLDTSSFARVLEFAGVIERGGSLGQLAKKFGIEVEETNLHDALVDCEVTYELLIKMSKLLKTPEPLME
jgi:DNA polymerase III epsilon subunit-like protein